MRTGAPLGMAHRSPRRTERNWAAITPRMRTSATASPWTWCRTSVVDMLEKTTKLPVRLTSGSPTRSAAWRIWANNAWDVPVSTAGTRALMRSVAWPSPPSARNRWTSTGASLSSAATKSATSAEAAGRRRRRAVPSDPPDHLREPSLDRPGLERVDDPRRKIRQRGQEQRRERDGETVTDHDAQRSKQAEVPNGGDRQRKEGGEPDGSREGRVEARGAHPTVGLFESNRPRQPVRASDEVLIEELDGPLE